MTTSVNQDLLDNAIGHRIDLTRYSNTVVRDILSILNAADAELVKKIQARQIDNWTTKRLNAVLADIRAIVAKAYGEASREMTQMMLDFAGTTANLTSSEMNKATPVTLSITSPTAEQLAAIVATEPIVVGEGQVALLEEIFHGLAANKEKTIRQAIRLGMVEGETVDQMVRRLIGTKAARFADGIIEKDRRGAEAMVRTIVNSTSNKAADATYKANGDIIKGLQWHATLDGRTTPICQARDGKLFPVDSGPRPPAHVNCRSFMVPVLKSWKDLGIDLDEMDEGTRASMDGQVPASMTYGAWLRGKGESFQNQVLGVERAKLFRSGEYDIKDFVNNKGEYKKLSDL